MSFTFIGNPTGRTISDSDLVTSGLDQPMSMGSTFWDQAKEGALSSFGLGTVIRESSLPALENNRPARGENPEARARRFTAYENSMTEEQYKASPSFRQSIPFQKGMTEDRAAALAEMDDTRKVREFYGQKRPVTAFLGNLAGSAVDPINYVPVGGELVVAANVARFGKVAGRALSASLDAAANTAVAGLATATTRGQLGDDVSWQSTVSQIAMAALIGGGFGAIHGRFGRDAPADLRIEASDKLSTLQNVQESRAALNDALDGMINRSEVGLSPSTTEFVARAADQEIPKVAISRLAREMDPEAFTRLDSLSKTFDINEAEIRRLQSLTLDNEAYGPTRGAMIEADQLAERLQSAQAAVDGANSDKARSAALTRVEGVKQQLRDRLSTIDDAKVQEIESIDQQLAQRRAVHAPVIAERSQLMARAEQLSVAAREQYWKDRTAQRSQEPPRAGPDALPAGSASADGQAPRSSIDTRAPVEPRDPSVAEAAKRVGKPEASRALAEQYRVDPKTGDFPEMDEVRQLESEGRLTEEDRASLEDADETLKTANAYGEAIKAFANCVI